MALRTVRSRRTVQRLTTLCATLLALSHQDAHILHTMCANKTDGVRVRGRPKGPIKCRNPAARCFFATCDQLGFSIREIRAALSAANARAPSYRSLQDWRRGEREPRFPPFDQWRSIILRAGRAPSRRLTGIQRKAT